MIAAAKKKFHGSQKMPQVTPAPTSTKPRSVTPPSSTDILRYRYHHGPNLGSIFVLERWLHPSMFPANCTGSNELDAVTASLANIGLERTREKWEAHWGTALPDSLLHWLVHTAYCTTIRLPVGYFTLGARFCVGTPFEGSIAQVYANAWTAVKKVVAQCREWGIGVLLDFHALPGGANGEAHSGMGSGRAGLWGNKKNLKLAERCLHFMAEEIGNERMEGVVGIQVCNEAGWDAQGLYAFYDMVIVKITEVDPSLPVYISDAWDLGRSMRYAVGKNSVRGGISNPVVVDTHRYYTFAEKDRERSPKEIIEQISGELDEVSRSSGNVFERKGACDVYVGEYSCTLDQRTWSRIVEDQRSALTREFGQAQCLQWQRKACGSAFWTLSMDWMPGGDWGFKEQADKGNITAPEILRLPTGEVCARGEAAERVRDDLMAQAVSGHKAYWNAQGPGKVFEHWRFAEGWELGWADARAFFCARSTGILSAARSTRPNEIEPADDIKHVSNGGDKIGLLDLWVLKRMKELACADKRKCPFGWEFEQALRQGVAAFYRATGI